MRTTRVKFFRIGCVSMAIVLLGLACQRLPVTKTASLPPEPVYTVDQYVTQVKLDSTRLIATVVLSELAVPWEITWGSDGWLWFTEQRGTVNRLNPRTGERRRLLTLTDVHYEKTRGLLGMALHPDLAKSPYVYLDYTYIRPGLDGPDSTILSKLVRYTYANDTLTDPLVLLRDIPGKTFHNGSRILITPGLRSVDNKLIMSTGDAGNAKVAQDVNSLSGKLLRMNLDGSVPADNPIPGSYVWTWGHRNPQGLVWAANGHLYSSEHGPANDDEVNRIEKGRNYGWPDVMGYADLPTERAYVAQTPVTEPLRAWTPIIAPGGIDYYNHPAIPEWRNTLLLAVMKGTSLRALPLNEVGDAIGEERIYFDGTLGRIRDLCVAPDGTIYLVTSNRDWHPQAFPALYDHLPRPFDDRIVKLSVATPRLRAWADSVDQLRGPLMSLRKPEPALTPAPPVLLANQAGAGVYQRQCAACHQADGQGVPGAFPPLSKTDWVTGDTKRLIGVVLRGLSNPIEVNGQRYDGEMPPQRVLSDQEVADVLTFVRGSFGNRSSPVTSAEVASERGG